MKNRLVVVLLSICLLTAGCASDQVKPLIDKGEYAKAYEIYLKDLDKYQEYKEELEYHHAMDVMDSDPEEALEILSESTNDVKKLKDEAQYKVAVLEVKKGNYQAALSYLENNEYEGAEALKKEAEEKLTDQEFVEKTAEAMDARNREFAARENEFNQDTYLIPVQKEYEIMKGFKDRAFYDQELKELADQYIRGIEGQIEGWKLWDENLFQASLKTIGANADRIEAISNINALHPLYVEEESSKERINSYNTLVQEGVIQSIYSTLNVQEKLRAGGMVTYTVTGSNPEDHKITPYEGETGIFLLQGNILDRDGNLVATMWAEQIPALRPGQSFEIDAWIDKEIGDLKDYYLE